MKEYSTGSKVVVIPKKNGIGAGTLFEKFTRKLGIKPCDGCNDRKKSLDRLKWRI